MYCGFSVVIKEYKETRELVFPFCKNKQDKRCMFCNNWGIILASHFCLVFYQRKSQSVLCSSTMGTQAKASPCAKQQKTMFLSRRIGTAFFMTWLSRQPTFLNVDLHVMTIHATTLFKRNMKTSFYTPSQSIFACVASTKAKIAIPKLSHFKGHYKNSSLRQNFQTEQGTIR